MDPKGRVVKNRASMCALAGAVVAAASLAAQADPVTVGFFRVTNNAGATNPASQMSCVVSDQGGGQVGFRFLNNVGIASSICDVYFDDGTLLAIASIASSSGVDFSQIATPGDLPGGNAVNFHTTQGFSADSNPPVSPNGVNSASEWLQINFTLQSAQTFADTIHSLQTGALRIGMHVQAIGQGFSDSFVDSPPTITTVPLPTAASLGMAGLLGAGLRRRRSIR